MNPLKGLGVSPGIARGEALVLRQRARHRYYLVPTSAIARELDRLVQARERSRTQLEEISARIQRLAGAAPASLFEAQILMLDDPMLTTRASELIEQHRRNAEWAVQQAADELGAMFNQADDPYLRERKGDLLDVVGRLRMNLTGESSEAGDLTADPATAATSHHAASIIVADDLPPSVAAQIDWTRTLAFITEVGSWTYHTAILARSLGVPAVVGVRDATEKIAPGAELIVDGTTGEVFLDVTDAAEQEILRRRSERALVTATYSTPGNVEPVTPDGIRIRLDANLELADDLADAVQAGAEGIGLYRSEFLLAGRLPQTVGEAAQTEVYRDLLQRMPGDVTIRTFDTRDIWPRGPGSRRRSRPGLRALRTDTEFQRQFEIQVRALLRAASVGRLRILLPFVAGVEDMRSARTLIANVARQLRADGVAVPEVPIGAMIEVPSAALTADRLAAESDFFGIGTNDLTALTLAADRAGEGPQVYDPLHPAVLRLLRFVRRAASRGGRRVSVCGEMASDPALLVLLMGLGYTEFSMAPSAIPRARHVVRHVTMAAARQVAREVFTLAPDEGRVRLDAMVQRAEETPLVSRS